MKPAELEQRLANIAERLDAIEEVRLLLAEKARLETELKAEQVCEEVRTLLDWVDADPQPLIRKGSRARRNGR